MKEKKKGKNKKLKIILSILLALAIIFGLLIFILLKNTFLMSHPELKGEPEVNKWYRITPKDAKSSDGSEWHGIFKLGKEKNKIIVYFFGGGVSITPETSEGGKEFYATNMMAQDFVALGGIGSDAEENPFKDWTKIVVPYASGDFHSGTGEYHYKDSKGKDKTIYHSGYNNYTLLMNEVKKYVDYENVDTLLVTGFSAGGFATSLLADDVIDYFPKVNNVTVAVDSSLLLYDDWHKSATELWKSPQEISDRLTGDNIVLDSLVALHNKRGNTVKILFDCSVRDDTLQQYQAYIDYGKMDKTKEYGDKFQKDLKQMVNDLQTNIDGVGIYIWEYATDAETKKTQHTIISSHFLDKLEDNKSIANWMIDSVNGNVKSYGLELLDNKY